MVQCSAGCGMRRGRMRRGRMSDRVGVLSPPMLPRRIHSSIQCMNMWFILVQCTYGMRYGRMSDRVDVHPPCYHAEYTVAYSV